MRAVKLLSTSVLFLAIGAPAPAQDTGLADVDISALDRWDLIRVEDPKAPGALARSETGALLAAPPESGHWRVEPTPWPDEYFAWEAAEAMDVSPWHDAGYRGQGVKVAVFDSAWGNWERAPEELGDIQTRDCYVHPGCAATIDSLRPKFGFESGGHGVACAEVIRDLAPDVELYGVRITGLTTFENAVSWAIREQIDVVSMSMSFFADSFYDGTGAVNGQVERLSDAGVLLVTSAGNYAGGHWWQDFADADNDGRHEFPWGSEYLPVYFSAGSKRLYLTWDDFRACGRTDLDAWMLDADGRVVARSEREQTAGEDGCDPVERIRVDVTEEGWHYLRVSRVRGAEAVRFDVMTPSGTVYQSMSDRSVSDPGSHPRAFTVGAVRGVGYLENGAESFSSEGPTHAGDPKPDLVAPDGLTCKTYGNTGFYGTSAATPAAAAAIALIMSRDPALAPDQAADLLASWAVLEDHPVWSAPDHELGAGKARLPEPDAAPGGCWERAGAWWMFALLPLGRLRRAGAGPLR